MRLIRPSSSSAPQSPHVEHCGRRSHRFATAGLLTTLYCPVRTYAPGARTVPPALTCAIPAAKAAPRCQALEDGPLGGDHKRELAREEVPLVGPGPGGGLGPRAGAHRGDVVEPGDRAAVERRRSVLSHAGGQVR